MQARISHRCGRWLLPFAYLSLASCFSLDTAVFLNRGYTEDDLVREEALEGRWAREDDMDAARLADYLKDHPLDLPNVTLGNGTDKQIVITAGPQETQVFLLLHPGQGDLMDEEYVLKRLPPQEAAEAGGEAQE